jgi:HK97 family phage portal protein
MEKVVKLEDRLPDLESDYVSADIVLNQKSLSPIDDQSDQSGYGVWNEELKAWIDLNTLKGLFYNDDWVYIILDRIASKVAAQELRVMKEQFENGVSVSTPQEDHPVQKMLSQPNENQTYYQWMYSIVVDLGLAGNSIIYRPKTIPSLLHIPVEMIQLDFTPDGELDFYRVIQYNTNYELPLPREVMRLDPSDVGHVRRPNPSSALWGLSPFIPGRKSVLFNRYSIEYLNNFYLKGAQPGLVLSLDDTANEKAALRLLRSMEMAHTGRKNQRRNMVLPKGVKATTLAQSLADQQLKDYIELNRETIINILQIPKHELSINSKGSALSNSSEYKIALKNFWSGPLKSFMKSIEASLTKLLASDLGEGYYLEFDLSDVEFLQEDLDAKADLAIKLLQTHTLNEVRAKIFDEKPLEGGDAVPTPKPIQSINAPTPAPTKSVPEVVTPKQSEVKFDNREKIIETNKAAFQKLKETNPNWWAQRSMALQRTEVQRFSDIHKAALNLFSDQIVGAIKVIRKNLSSQGIKQKDTFRKSELKRKIRDALSQLEQQWLDETGPTLEATLDVGYDSQLILPFNLPNRSEIETLRATRLQNRRDMLNGRLSEVFAGLNQTTTDKIMKIIEEGVSNSRTLQEISDNIVEDVGSPALNSSRANTIARTEVLTATSIGQAAAMQDASQVIPNLKKMWINAGDDRVRGNPDGIYKNTEADHWTLGGELIDHDGRFSNGLSYPRDPDGDASEVINCRCTFIMVPGDDADALGIRDAQREYDDLQKTDNAGSE